MRIVIIFLRHYVFCLVGGWIRYLFENCISNLKKTPITSYKAIKDYNENPSNEFLDIIIGGGVLLCLVYLIIEITS
ncbi:MAG: hypothetical protein H6584_08970 [Flavobacteriales bacterium]|nr:hypothetical protein [Flavobacteriales bacterium]